MLRANPASGLLRDAAELRQDRSVFIRDVGGVADRVDPGDAPDRQIALDVDPATVADRQPGLGDDRRGHLAAAPDCQVCLDDGAVAEHHVVAGDFLCRTTLSCSFTPRRVSCLVAYSCAASENTDSGSLARSTMIT